MKNSNETSGSVFAPWHMQCMRMRLKSYKMVHNYGWIDVAENIICSVSNDLDFPEISELEENKLDLLHHGGMEGTDSRAKQDLGWPIQSQDLLRFADGVKNNKTGKRVVKGISKKKLMSVCNFLKDKSYLPANFFELNNNEQFYNAVYSMIDYLEIPQTDQTSNDVPELSGDYKYIEKDDKKIIDTDLEFIASSSHKPFYFVKQIIDTYTIAGQRRLSSENFSGWGVHINSASDALLLFLKIMDGADHTGFENNRRSFFVSGIKSYLDEAKAIALNRLTGQHIISQDDVTMNSISKSLILNRYYGDSCQKPFKSDNIVDIRSAKKDTSKILSFGKGNTAADKWKKHQNTLSNKVSDKKKGRGMVADKDNAQKFLNAAANGHYWEVEEYMNAGIDVNHEHPKTKVRAIHAVASHNAVPALKELMKSNDLEYLAVDSKGHLPSYYAWVTSDNPVLGTFLQKKEIEEAKIKGIDYESFIKNPIL